MAEKHTTLTQAKLIALRNKSEMFAMLLDALGGVQVGMIITLPAENWEGREQTIQNESLVADGSYWYFSLAETNSAGIRADNVTTDGEITFHCDTTPDSDLIVYILRLEVDT